MNTYPNTPRLNREETEEYCSMLALKYKAHAEHSTLFGNLFNDERIVGEDTLYWILEFFAGVPNDVYVIENRFSVLRISDGRSVIPYIQDKDWLEYEYFISDATGNYLWKIWHEEAIHAWGSASTWLQDRKRKILELLDATVADTLLISEIRFPQWGQSVEIAGEVQPSEIREAQPFTLSFRNCSRIHWNPPWGKALPSQVKITQSYFGQEDSGNQPLFFALRAEGFDIRFNYQQVEVSKT